MAPASSNLTRNSYKAPWFDSSKSDKIFIFCNIMRTVACTQWTPLKLKLESQSDSIEKLTSFIIAAMTFSICAIKVQSSQGMMMERR